MRDAADRATPSVPAVRRVVLAPRGGEVGIEEGRAPVMEDREVMIRTAFSVVSAGTERSKLEFAARSLLGKARSRPDAVRQVLEKLRREGPSATVRAVRRRLDEPVALGYSSAGTVMAVGARADGVRPGDPVAAGGGGYALHADVACVPKNLVARVPAGVPLDAAAFGTLGAVAMHGFRLSKASLGETVAVVGLGSVGLLTGSVAKAAGCRVLGIDLRPEAAERARALGFDHAVPAAGPVEEALGDLTSGAGADAVLVCAAASDAAPVTLAGRIARDRATVVVVGNMPLHIPRDLYYAKELELVVSRSYGPGRYDPSYEEGGHDYPVGYVRWTERRNIEAFLRLLADGLVDPLRLVTHRFPVQDADEAYKVISTTPGSVVLLAYDGVAPPARSNRPPGGRPIRSRPAPDVPRVGLIGTGSFATRVLVPAIEADGQAEVAAVASIRGRSGHRRPAMEVEELLADPGIDAVVIATRHGSHAGLAVAALEAGKAVFVEKPLALSRTELADVVAARVRAEHPLMVGFNRRHAPLAIRLRELLAQRPGPAIVTIHVAAGELAPDHWARDLEVGGGRILGEMCHVVDLVGYLLGHAPVVVFAAGLGDGKAPQASEDVAASLRYPDGSVGLVVYTAMGDASLPKEVVRVDASGTTWVLEDWRRLETAASGRRRTERVRPDKGHRAEMAAFLAAVRGRGHDGFESSVRSTAATLAIVESLSLGIPVEP